MISRAFHLRDSAVFIQKALAWGSQFENLCYLDSNGYRDNYGNISAFVAAGEKAVFEAKNSAVPNPVVFHQLQKFADQHTKTWIPGFLGYDLKNELENLVSRNIAEIDFPDAYFFVPKYVLLVGQFNVEVQAENPDEIFKNINEFELPSQAVNFRGKVQSRMNKAQYAEAFATVQRHIQQGDVYEANLCQEFYADNATVDPVALFLKLNAISQTPFACFFKFGERYIASASPERFLTKRNHKLISQPIKGTAKRGITEKEDAEIKSILSTHPKELSENLMIVDLVRNDLTRSAKEGTVKVTELTKLYTFKQVHQLVSTIECEAQPHLSACEMIANTFPPGSMTGAPKISAMKLIDQVEKSRRGVYSGAIGYFSPQGNFDFSVVIRTVLYDALQKRLSFHTGGAITAQSTVDEEYSECLLKGKAIFEVLDTHIS